MARIVSLKSLLLLMVVVVIGLILVYMSRCTTTVPTSFKSISKKSSLFGYEANKVQLNGDGGGLSYYQSINEEEVQPAYPVRRVSSPNTKKYVGASHLKKNEEGGLDYPFEEDFDGENDPLRKNQNQPGAEDNEDGFEGYRIPSNDKLRLRNLKTSEKEIANIICNINHGKYKIGCKKDSSDDVYIPFNFIHKYFEIYGKLEPKEEGKEQTFTWLHSQVNIYRPKTPYNPKGVFTYFANYNVEVRERVKCISGSEGVPVSTQWDINGYFYPIQIAQFGLSHFSKYLTEGEPKRIILEDGDEVRGGWLPVDLIDTLPNDNNDPMTNHYVHIQTPSTTVATEIKLSIPPTKPRMLLLSWQMRILVADKGQPNVTFTATVRYESQVFYLHYVTADFLIQVKENHIYHGLGYKSTGSWQHLIRDLGVDVQKGVSLLSTNNKKAKTPKILKSKLQLESISIESAIPGTSILLDNITLSTNEHLAQFFQAADWFVSHQDDRGGWPIPVRRKFASDFYPVLESGWYSAMGQGHALSLLARAYSITTNNSQYADACVRALSTIFDHPGTENGVRAYFMEKFVWYEEYPTTPSSFVLNGFMYALFGLYDVKSIEVLGASEKANQLYTEGLTSLKAMLPLYDTGSGTMYDLRHQTVPGISPNLARLDYHVTHINQLLTFATFEKDPIFETTAERWVGYTNGDRAPHN